MTSRAVLVGVMVAMVATAAAQPRKPKPPPPVLAPIDPAMLPVWGGNVEGGAVQVHALDVEGEVLRQALLPRGQWVTTPVARRISGRIAVRKRAAAFDALVALEPALATAGRPLRGSGTKVDLDFRAASNVDLYRLFADVMRTNIVVLAPAAELTVRVKRAPVGGVLAEVARVSGAELDRPAPNLIVVRPASEPRTPFMPSSGAKLRVDANDIHAGILVALIRALDPPPRTSPRDTAAMCNGGQAVTFRLNKIATQVALMVTARAGGADLSGPRCALPVLPPGTDPRTLRLTAVVERGAQRMAAVEVDGKGAFLLDGRDLSWMIGSSYIQHNDPSGDVLIQLHGVGDPIGDPFAPADAASLRLAATVIDGRERLAIVEVGGWAQIWTQGRPVRLDGSRMVDIAIEPGQVTLRDDGRVLKLTPRAAVSP